MTMISSCVTVKQKKISGFSVLEILVVVAIIAVLVTLVLYGVGRSKDKARDNAIRNAIRQMRWEAEIVYDTKGGSYKNWATAPEIQPQLSTLKAEIDKHYGVANQYVLCDSQRKEYCASAPLKAEASKQYCIDATGTFTTVNAPCNCAPTGNPPQPLRCPAS